MPDHLPLQDVPLQDATLQAYVNAFETLTPDTLDTNLGLLLADNVVFKDPFNHVTGRTATLAVFKHMFATVSHPKFTVFMAAQDPNMTRCALLYWQFDFELPSNQSAQQIDGMSRVTFNTEDLVSEHTDYWDAGEQVYAKVPLLGWGIRQVIKRLSAHP